MGQIGNIEISSELEGDVGCDYDVSACACKYASIVAFMHTIFLHVKANISTKLGQIREIEVFTVSREHAGHV